MPGEIKTHWVCLRSHAHPTATDVMAGMVCLGTDGATIYMTTADGTTTPINGAAVMSDIVITDNTADAFRVREAALGNFLRVDSTNSAEVLYLGNSTATLTSTLEGGTVNVLSGGDASISATGITILSSGGDTEIGGDTLYVGEQGSANPVRIGTTGARSLRVGSNSATEFLTTAQNNSLTMDANGVAMVVKDAEEFSLTTQSGHTIMATDFATTDDITIGDVGAFAGQRLILDVDEVLFSNDASVSGALVVTGDITANAAGNFVLQGGGEITNGTDPVVAFNSSGELTRLGDNASPTLNHVLTWTGSKWEPAAPSGGGGGAASLSDLSDVDNGLSPSNDEILAYSGVASTFNAISVSTALGGGSVHDLSDVAGSGGTVGQMLMWGPTAHWTPTDVSIQDLHSVNITTGAPVDGHLVSWDQSAAEWVAVAPYSDSDAVAAVEAEATLDLTGTATTQAGNPSALASLGGGGASLFSEEISTNGGAGASEFFVTDVTTAVYLTPGYRYEVMFSGIVFNVAGAPPAWRPAFKLSDNADAKKVIFAARKGVSTGDTQGQEELHFTFKCSFTCYDDPLDSGTKRYLVPSGFAGYSSTDVSQAFDYQTMVVGWDYTLGTPIRFNHASASQTQNAMAVLTPDDTLTELKVGIVVGAGLQHTTANHINVVITGAWVNASPGLAVGAGAGSNWPVIP